LLALLQEEALPEVVVPQSQLLLQLQLLALPEMHPPQLLPLVLPDQLLL
jgi:hypothetical protein